MHARVDLDSQHQVGAIDQRLFGGFLEHLGRAVYEGIYDPGNALSDDQGFRQDVLEALRALRMPVVRYPGGNFVSSYDWTDGIGPRAVRPVRPDFAWQSLETNQFGTDEFMAWCAALGSAPMLAVNLGTGGATGAMALLEYCNFPGGTAWSDRRRANGHAEPYGVKLWCLGNEMDGPWQAGHVPAAVYAQRADQAGAMMKGLDPTIETVVCGSSYREMTTYLQWDREVLEYCWDRIDYISAHRYSRNDDGDSAWYLAEGLEVDRTLDDYAGLLAYVRGATRSQKRVYLSFDEWNVWYKNRGGEGGWRTAPHLCEEEYNLEDALVCAQYLTSFLRHADTVKIACIAQIVNALSPIHTWRDGLLLHSTYYPLLLFAQHAQGQSLVPVVTSPLYQAGARGEAPVLDVAASYLADGETASVFLVNRDMHEELDVTVHFADKRVLAVTGVDVLGGNLKAVNTRDVPHRVAPVRGSAVLVDAGPVRVHLPAPGLAAIRLALGTQ